MSKRWILALGALALCLSTAVWGDYNVLDKQSYNQNATNGSKVDANGNAYVNEASKDRDNYQIVTVCDDTLSNGASVGMAWANAGGAFAFTAESLQVTPCYSYRRFSLMFRVIPPAADTTNRLVRVAVQIRKHTDATGDSASTFAWTGWTNLNLIATADSAGAVVQSSGNAALAYANERVFTFDSQRGRGLSVADQSNGAWPDGMAVDLQDSRGQWFWAPYISVRVRLIGYAGTGKPRVICKLAMGS